jgi:hypothetical protein
MPLQDIKYSLTVDDREAQNAIRRTVNGFKQIGNTNISAHARGDADFSKMLSGATGALQSQAAGFSDIIANAVAGGFGSTVLSGMIVRTISAGASAISGVFESLGKSGGKSLAKGLAASGKQMSAAAKKEAAEWQQYYAKSQMVDNIRAQFGEEGRYLKAHLAKKLAMHDEFNKIGAARLREAASLSNLIFGNSIAKMQSAVSAAQPKIAAGWTAIAGPAKLAFAGVALAGTLAASALVAGANHANHAWSEVEDGIMQVQAALVGAGQTVQQAFSSKVEASILNVGKTMAFAVGMMQKDSAAATAVLVSNGMTVEQAQARLGVVANIAAVKTISHAEAAQKLIAAWNGEAKALKELDVRFASTGDASKDAARAMGAVIEKYGNPALAKQFLDDEPMQRASAAINDIWVNLGKVLDPSKTAVAQQLADILLGIADSINLGDGSGFADAMTGAFQAIMETANQAATSIAIAWNGMQMIGTLVRTTGELIWNGVQYAFAWIKDKIAEVVQFIGTSVSLIPGLGDKGDAMTASGRTMQQSAQQTMATAGDAFAESARAGMADLKRDWNDVAGMENGGAFGVLERKGKAARDREELKAAALLSNGSPLGESPKVRQDREDRRAQEAAKQAEKQQQEAEKQKREDKRIFEQNQKITQERNRIQVKNTIVLQTSQRMIPALRFTGRKR